jgi:hypothetical protein
MGARNPWRASVRSTMRLVGARLLSKPKRCSGYNCSVENASTYSIPPCALLARAVRIQCCGLLSDIHIAINHYLGAENLLTAVAKEASGGTTSSP